MQRQEVLRIGGEGELVREPVETIQPPLYTAKDGRVEVQQLASSSTLNLLVQRGHFADTFMAKYSISQQATVGRRRKSLILLGLQQAAVGVHGFKPIIYPI